MCAVCSCLLCACVCVSVCLCVCAFVSVCLRVCAEVSQFVAADVESVRVSLVSRLVQGHTSSTSRLECVSDPGRVPLTCRLALIIAAAQGLPALGCGEKRRSTCRHGAVSFYMPLLHASVIYFRRQSSHQDRCC